MNCLKHWNDFDANYSQVFCLLNIFQLENRIETMKWRLPYKWPVKSEWLIESGRRDRPARPNPNIQNDQRTRSILDCRSCIEHPSD